jgi:TPR repeat protein
MVSQEQTNNSNSADEKAFAAHRGKSMADQRDADAQFKCGLFLASGDGVPILKSLATHCFQGSRSEQ